MAKPVESYRSAYRSLKPQGGQWGGLWMAQELRHMSDHAPSPTKRGFQHLSRNQKSFDDPGSTCK